MLQMNKRTASAGCNPAKVARRRNEGQMCTCRRRSGASSTGEYACVGDSIVRSRRRLHQGILQCH